MKYLILILMLLVGCSATDQTEHEVPMDDSLSDFINEFNNRTIYKTLDQSTLASIADDDLEQAIVDYVAQKIESAENEESALESLPPGCRNLWLTWIVDGEVNNGGFNQLYWNTNDKHNEQAVEALRYFSANKHADLMHRANEIRASEIDAINKYKDRNTLEAFSESYGETKLGPIDDLYYELQDDLSDLRIAKIRKKPEAFCGD